MVQTLKATPLAPVTRLPAATERRERLSEQATLREVMGQFATGITVLTAGGESAHGMTANAFSSVSLDPPMVLCCVSRAARMHESILAAGTFAVSILADDQRDLAKHFADWRRPRGMAQFDAVDWFEGPSTGTPLLSDCLAWLECELTQAYDGGDHTIFLGSVLNSSRRVGSPAPLVFYGGAYREVATPYARATA
jgi:flavin reductase (DIM6/NTAB) family NADH-FMN oxidoreductase RutF